MTRPAVAEQLIGKLHDQAELNDSGQWLALEIEAGYPVIDAANSAQLIPQATNLQALEGISFSKGCYTGQEMVARAKFAAPTSVRSTGWKVRRPAPAGGGRSGAAAG